MELCNSFTDSNIVCVQKLAQFCGSRINERRISLQFLSVQKFVRTRQNGVGGYLQSCNPVIFLFFPADGSFKEKALQHVYKKMVTIFRGYF